MKVFTIVFIVISVLVCVVYTRSGFYISEKNLDGVKNRRASELSKLSGNRSESKKYNKSEKTAENYPIKQLYETRNSRRGINALNLFNNAGKLNENLLFSQGFTQIEIKRIEHLVNDLRTNVFSLVRENTKLINAEKKSYRTEKYDEDFSAIMAKLYSELMKFVASEKANFVIEAVPLEDFEGFSGKYAVDFMITPPDVPGNPYDEFAKTYWLDAGSSKTFGTMRWSQASKLMGSMTLDDNGLIELD